MKATYQTEVVAICPTTKEPKNYDIWFVSEEPQSIEGINIACKSYQTKQISQEELTEELSTQFACNIRTIGEHSGVKTTVKCP